ncbi:MAG: hypothetical protein MHM6MM_009356, partial [Cercozoa sp. M6MM]
RRKGADAEGPLEVVVTTFELVTLDRIALSAVHWEYVVVDEAHRLKNVQSRLARTLSSFESKQRLLLTGTPLQNNLGELWALLNFLMPGASAEEESNEEDDKKILQLLHRVLQPLLLRCLAFTPGADAEGPLEVVVTTFELVTLDRIALSAVHWEYVVVDEAHRLKNVQSRLARTLSSFESKQRLLLTGTPLQNNLGELWALLNFLMPGASAEEESNEEDDKKILQLLHRVLQPLLLR